MPSDRAAAISVVVESSEAGRLRVALLGELDAFSAWELERQMATALALSPQRLEVEIARLDFIDVAGFRALESAQAQADRAGVVYEVLASPWQLRIAGALKGLQLNIGLLPGNEGWHMRVAGPRVVWRLRWPCAYTH